MYLEGEHFRCPRESMTDLGFLSAPSDWVEKADKLVLPVYRAVLVSIRAYGELLLGIQPRLGRVIGEMATNRGFFAFHARQPKATKRRKNPARKYALRDAPNLARKASFLPVRTPDSR
jgi:hypothetical protein